MSLSYYTIRYYIKSILSAVVLAVLAFIWRKNWSLIGVSDACAISGICFLILALFRLTRCLHFYDLVLYGFKKFKQIWKNENFMEKDTGSYADYINSRHYEKNYGETFIAAVIMFVVSVVILAI